MNRIVTIGSINGLEALFKASTTDLVRRFRAKSTGTTYVLPLETTPWFTTISLGRKYPITNQGKTLTLKNVKIINYTTKPWYTVIIGFLTSEGQVVGTALTGSKPINGCIITPLTPPLDLYETPKNVEFPKPTAILREELIRDTVNITTPTECLENTNTTTDQIILYTNLVSNMTRTQIDLTKAELTYE
ncbi:hypothetical protein [Vulcanisaeta thermophila]|uniref:hypothetical protein n=1 Tax=Vulcanisaeta thermophila TaxID=867917 RepID=UPI00085314CB|nr:hypothetical protein [Vulcanisaeta thermophila]